MFEFLSLFLDAALSLSLSLLALAAAVALGYLADPEPIGFSDLAAKSTSRSESP